MGKDQAEAVFEDHRDVKQGYGWHPLAVLIAWSGIFLFLVIVPPIQFPGTWTMEKEGGWFYYLILLGMLWFVGVSAAWYYHYRTTLKRLKFEDEGVEFQTFADFLNKRDFGRKVRKGELKEIRPFHPGWFTTILNVSAFFDHHKPSYKLILTDGTVRYVMSGMPGAEEAVARLREFRG